MVRAAKNSPSFYQSGAQRTLAMPVEAPTMNELAALRLKLTQVAESEPERVLAFIRKMLSAREDA